MKFWRTVDIADNERALLYFNGRFEKVLEPGRVRIPTFNRKMEVKRFDISDLYFADQKAKFLLTHYREKLEPFLESFELSDTEVGLLYRDGHLMDVLAPGSFLAVWKGVEKVELKKVDIATEYGVDKNLLGLLTNGVRAGQLRNLVNAIHYVEIPNQHVGFLLVNGQFEKLLSADSYGFWKFNRSIVVKTVDLRLQNMEVNGQEILTKDRVSLRVNLSASYKIVEPTLAALQLSDYAAFIYRELQLRLREAVGTQELDNLLEDKDSLNGVIANSVRESLAEFGIELISVGVKDIILPGDMKLILNQVVQAQKEAEANLIKRREETQAMRSLHNTAKLMENNPVLLRLKELESLERITLQVDKLSVVGGLDALMNNLVSLAPKVDSG